MDKQFADNMISQFQKKFFGFALEKCKSLEEAEELAARITCEAYITLRTVEEVYNWEGYLYRIATNVFSRYVKEQIKHKSDSIDDKIVSYDKDFESDYVKKEELDILKREIAWLGKMHREIIILHYYHNKKLSEIAKQLDIPEGTVKWHLSDAKNQLKEGMKQVRTEGRLGIEPIKLVHMGNMGSVGEMGDTESFLNSKLRQNIVFAAYFEPKTIEEIAQELGVSPVYVEDEVEYLEEYGFLDLLPGKKYRTNVFIECVPYQEFLKVRDIDREIVSLICDEFVPMIIDHFSKYDMSKVYIPENDMNFYLWTMISRNIAEIGAKAFDWDEVRKKNYMVKRKDGGEFIAIAELYQKELEDLIYPHEKCCGPMYVGDNEEGVFSWSMSTNFDNRTFGWEDNQSSDYMALNMFINGNLPKTEAVLDKYIRLYERGLLVHKDDGDKVNIIVIKEGVKDWIQVDEDFDIEQAKMTLLSKLCEDIIPLPEDLRIKMEELLEKKVQMEKQYFPKHMHHLLEIMRRTRHINLIMVLDELLKREVLQPLTEEQKKGVMIVIYSDILPGEKEF